MKFPLSLSQKFNLVERISPLPSVLFRFYPVDDSFDVVKGGELCELSKITKASGSILFTVSTNK